MLSGAAFPADLGGAASTPSRDDPEAVRAARRRRRHRAVPRELLAGGAPGLHFYTLNRSTATREVYARVVPPPPPPDPAAAPSPPPRAAPRPPAGVIRISGSLPALAALGSA
ncbi:MAG: methylenetetrahydrofolate reductase [Verrucomicrobiota bacterium]